VNATDVASIPAEVRAQAEEPMATGRELPPGMQIERIRTSRFTLVIGPVLSVNPVQGVRLAADDVGDAVEEVRQLLRDRGRIQAAWFIAPSSTPADLEQRLREIGFAPYDEPPLEPEFAAMAIVRPPLGASDDSVVARAVEGYEELVTASRIVAEAAGMSERDRAGMDARVDELFRLHELGDGRWYVAFVDGEPVGAARGTVQDAGINLSGAAVLPSARGRGAFRALVEARWRDAVAQGTPALTVQAGRMSRPILERLGFTTVATVPVLCDRFE
jgi:GNAT superfamily N-acetyltransferase